MAGAIITPAHFDWMSEDFNTTNSHKSGLNNWHDDAGYLAHEQLELMEPTAYLGVFESEVGGLLKKGGRSGTRVSESAAFSYTLR